MAEKKEDINKNDIIETKYQASCLLDIYAGFFSHIIHIVKVLLNIIIK